MVHNGEKQMRKQPTTVIWKTLTITYASSSLHQTKNGVSHGLEAIHSSFCIFRLLSTVTCVVDYIVSLQ